MAVNKWIQKAVPPSREGIFTRKAAKAGYTGKGGVQKFAGVVTKKKKAGKPVPTELLREALLAKNFKRMAAKRKAGK